MAEDDDLPRVLSGRYRLEATLGQGGMGVVYRGTDLTIERSVAVKVIRSADGVQLDEEIAGRFLREAKNTARLHHEHIIEVFDLGRSEEGGLYFVMELLEGESLSARIRRERQLSPATVVHIGAQICLGLQAAHAAGVIHRDLKPANVMLISRAEDDDFVKVLDFGVAKSLAGDQQTQLTHTGMLVGTIDYMAPEQIMGRPVDARTDIYALGIVLYRMLSGKAPFRDAGVPALIHAHLNTMPKPLVEIVPGVPKVLDEVVLRCLAKDPDHRFQSMAEVAAVLEATLRNTSGLPDVAYRGRGGTDDYEEGEPTVVAFSPRPPNSVSLSDPLPADDTTIGRVVSERSSSDRSDRLSLDDTTIGRVAPAPEAVFDETTIRIGAEVRQRPHFARAATLPSTSHDTQRSSTVPPGRLSGSPRKDIPTLAPPMLEETRRIERGDPRPCAMCQTVNAAHVRTCLACGVSLASDEQDAVRARVRAGSSGATSVPPTGASASRPPDPMRGALPPHRSGPYQGAPPVHGTPSMPWLVQQPPQGDESPSIWKRFLTWTGIRNR